MPIPFKCPHCAASGHANEKHIGRVVACPKCGNRVTIGAPPLPAPDAIKTRAGESEEQSSSSALLIVVVSVVVISLIGALSYTFLAPDPSASILADRRPAQSEPVKSPVIEAASDTSTADAAEPVDEPIEKSVAAPAEERSVKPPGFGLTLEQFKGDVPIGKGWNVLSETTREDGTVVFQLVGTTLRTTLLSVTGDPNDLGEISFTFGATSEHTEADTLARVATMSFFLSKYTNWTLEEINQFFGRLIQVGAGGETSFRAQKDGHEFWISVMGVENGTMFMTGVSANPNSTAPTLQQWLDDHPVPVGAGLTKSTERSGRVDADFALKGFRHKGEGSFIGEMVNESGQVYKFATFKLSIYGDDAELIDTGAIVITNFGDGQTRSFEAYVEGTPRTFFYKIDFEHGL